MHNVIHAQIENGDRAAGVLNLRDGLDLARLLARCGPEFDFDALAGDARKRGFFRSLSGAIHCAHRAFQSPLPEAFAGDVQGRLHAWRCLQQRYWGPLDRILQYYGVLRRALTWERDAYILNLENRLSLKAQVLVNKRRFARIKAAIATYRRGRAGPRVGIPQHRLHRFSNQRPDLNDQTQKAACRQFELAIVTVARPGEYVHTLLTALRSDMPLRLVVGSPDYHYLERYRNNDCIKIIEVPTREWRRFRNLPIRQRASWNYWRGLIHGISAASGAGLVLLEDDVIPARDWECRLRATIDQIERDHSGQYVLALYTPSQVPLRLEEETCYAEYPASFFFGSQGMYYPEPVRRDYAAYLKKYGVDTFVAPYDVLLGEYLQATGLRLFAAVPSLVQHIGEISTGLASFHHTSSMFSN